MNSLSWLIYLAQVLTSLGHLFIGIAVVFGIGSVVGFGMMVVFSTHEYEKASFAEINKRGRLMLTCFLPPFIVCLALGNALPDKDTLYAIAASQLGERIVASGEAKELANDAYAALRVWLKKQIAEGNPPK